MKQQKSKSRRFNSPSAELPLKESQRTSFWGDKSMVQLRRVRVEDMGDVVRVILVSRKTSNHSNYIEFSKQEFDELCKFFQSHNLDMRYKSQTKEDADVTDESV